MIIYPINIFKEFIKLIIQHDTMYKSINQNHTIIKVLIIGIVLLQGGNGTGTQGWRVTVRLPLIGQLDSR